MRRYFKTLLLLFLGDGENESAMSKTNPKCSKNPVYLIQWILKSLLVGIDVWWDVFCVVNPKEE